MVSALKKYLFFLKKLCLGMKWKPHLSYRNFFFLVWFGQNNSGEILSLGESSPFPLGAHLRRYRKY